MPELTEIALLNSQMLSEGDQMLVQLEIPANHAYLPYEELRYE